MPRENQTVTAPHRLIRPFITIVVAAIGILAPTAVSSYGGEDVLKGAPWHHLDNTLRALAGDNELAGTPDRNSNLDPAIFGGSVPPVFEGVGFTREAAMSVAWHADYIDSYLYNPLFWAGAGLTSKRLKAAMVDFDDLAKLHHDDTFTAEGLSDNWTRYGAGTLIGLYWASLKFDPENGRNEQSRAAIAMAHNILGVSSHAVQDFYSHSNWMDNPERRTKTYLEYARQTRADMNLFAGAYEHAATQAPAHHGAYSVSCTVLGGQVSGVLDEVCGGLSPLQNTALCKEHRACRSATQVTVSTQGIAPNNIVYLNPRGIALDTTWLTRIDGVERGVLRTNGSFSTGKGSPRMDEKRCNSVINYGVQCKHDQNGEPCYRLDNSLYQTSLARSCSTDSDYLFAASKELAIRSTMQWMEQIERSMNMMGERQKKFWAQVKMQGSTMGSRTAQFEDFKALPFQFLSAGPYPVGNPGAGGDHASSSNGYYLRLQIKTANVALAGTDADIYARLSRGNQTRDFLLDYLPTNDPTGRTDSRIFVYNDFERGDHDAYIVGPVPFRPTKVELFNRSANGGDVAVEFWDSFTTKFDHALTGIRRTIIGLIGGNADFVGEAVSYSTRAELLNDIAGGENGVRTRAFTVNGGDEGRYRLYYQKREVTTGLTAAERAAGWKAFEFKLLKLKCLAESTVDRFSTHDEPFFFFSVAPLNGLPDAKVLGHRHNPFSNVDSGEERTITSSNNGHIKVIKLPPNGGVALAVQIFESDDENANDRRQLYQTFITGLDEQTRRGNTEFLDTVGRAVAADWKVDRIEAFLFKRGPMPEAKQVLSQRNVGWIEGGESKAYNLDAGNLNKLIANDARAVNNWFVPTGPLAERLRRSLEDPFRKPSEQVDPGVITSQRNKAPILPKPSQTPALEKLPSSPTPNTPTIDTDLLPGAWQGTWSSSFGELRLRQDSTRIYGDYSNVGVIDGEISGATASGRFTNGDREGVFEFNLDDGKITGKWRWSVDKTWRGDWTATRTSTNRPLLRNGLKP